jgi:hypothetical protein
VGHMSPRKFLALHVIHHAKAGSKGLGVDFVSLFLKARGAAQERIFFP